jgi:hypothetical protein
LQTSSQIIDRLIRNQPPFERVGFHDSPWGDTLEKWIGQGYPTDAEKKPVDPVDHFAFDMVGVGGWFDYKEVIDFFHSYNLPVVLHSCGGIEAALPLIVEAGFDALNPMQVKAGCDALRFAEKHGDRLAFVGGLDAMILESGDRDLIRQGVIRLVDGMKARGARYVFGSDHSLSTNVRYEDFKYAVQVYKEHMMY